MGFTDAINKFLLSAAPYTPRKQSSQVVPKGKQPIQENKTGSLGVGGPPIKGEMTAVQDQVGGFLDGDRNRKLNKLTNATGAENEKVLATDMAPVSPLTTLGTNDYYNQTASPVDAFSAYQPKTVLPGGERVNDPNRSILHANAGRTDLERELNSREMKRMKSGTGYATGTNGSGFAGGAGAIEPEKLKALKDMGLVNVKSKDDIAQGQHEAWMHNYKMLVSEGRSSAEAKMMADNQRNGKRLGDGVNNGATHTRIGAPSRGGFFESLGKYSDGVRANKEARSDDRYWAEQDRLRTKDASDIAYKDEQTAYYGELKQSVINARNAKTDGQLIKNGFMPEKLLSEINLTDSKTGLNKARADVIPDNARVNQILKLAQAGNQDAMAYLTGVKADLLPEESRAKVASWKAGANYSNAGAGLKTAQTKEVAANAESLRELNKARTHLTSEKGDQISKDSAIARELIGSRIANTNAKTEHTGAQTAKVAMQTANLPAESQALIRKINSGVDLSEAKTGKLNAETVEIAYSAASQRLLDAAKADNFEARAALLRVNASTWTAEKQAEIKKINEETKELFIMNKMFSNISMD